MPEAYKEFSVYITIDYKILFTFMYGSENNTSQELRNSTLEPEWRIYGSILQKDSNKLDLFLIYQTSTPQFQYVVNTCGQSYDGSGFYCIIGFINLNNELLAVKTAFLSNGKIIETKMDSNLSDANNIVA